MEAVLIAASFVAGIGATRINYRNKLISKILSEKKNKMAKKQ